MKHRTILKMFRRALPAALVAAAVVPAFAGPPLICSRFDIGTAASLPWNVGPNWRGAVDTYDRSHDAATRKLEAADTARWSGNVPFTFQGQTVMNDPGAELAWGFLLDMIHHRGQLSTYLRPMGAKVPQIYGPSADEPM